MTSEQPTTAAERLLERIEAYANPTFADDMKADLIFALDEARAEARQQDAPALVWRYAGSCPDCGHVIEADLPALPPSAPAGLDVDLLAEALRRREHPTWTTEQAAEVAAEYARLGEER